MPHAIPEHRRNNNQRRVEALKTERREASVKKSRAARETLITRLRAQLGPPPPPPAAAAAAARDVDGDDNKRKVATRRSASAAALPPPLEQPPTKYRKISKAQDDDAGFKFPRLSTKEGVGTAVFPSPLQDIDMVDAEQQQEEEEEEEEVDASAPPPPTTTTGKKRDFLDMLNDTIVQRRAEGRRISSEDGSSPLALRSSSSSTAAKRRKKKLSSSPPLGGGGGGVGAGDPSPSPSPTQKKLRHRLFSDVDARVATWEPPVSPFGLVEEELFSQPWRLLVACMLLNKTTANQVRRVLPRLFSLCPTPAAAVAAETAALEAIIQPLGLFRKRAVALQRMSDDYINKDWCDPQELFGCGVYSSDAYFIFCRGQWRDIEPDDKDLKRYKEWLVATGGQGSGLIRDRSLIN